MSPKQQQTLAKAFTGYGTYLGSLAPIIALVPGGQAAAPLLAAGSALQQSVGRLIEKRIPKVLSASPGLKVNYAYGGNIDPVVVLQNLIRASYSLPSSSGKLIPQNGYSARVGGKGRQVDSEKFFVPYA